MYKLGPRNNIKSDYYCAENESTSGRNKRTSAGFPCKEVNKDYNKKKEEKKNPHYKLSH